MTQRTSERVRAPENADALAELLRADTASSEDMQRMERSIARGLRERRPVRSSAPGYAFAITGLALAAAALFWLTRPAPTPEVAETSPAPVVPAPPSIRELRGGDELASGQGQLRNAHLSVTDGSHAVVDDDAITHAAVTLARGEIHVAFHPEHRGEEHLAIVTDLARVEVVGTEFVVTRGEAGTHVRVIEGVVRVVTLATSDEHVLRAGDEVEVEREVEVEVEREVEVEHPSLATVADVRAAAARDDVDALARIADHGDREARLSALEELTDRSVAAHASVAAIGYCTRVIALDPSGSRGATALFDRAGLHERAHDGAAADDFARYLAGFPRGEFAEQARQHLCTLDPSRCSAL